MSKRPLGAYAQRNFNQDKNEVERLRLQATIAIDREKKAWQEAGLLAGMQVLDLGCGPGFTSRELVRQVGQEGHVTGIDVNPTLLEIAHKTQQESPLANLGFQQGNVYDLAFPETSFDFVYARFVFQHLADPQAVLSQIQRVLKPGGICCILDVDDSWTSFTPATSAFKRFLHASGKAQNRRNGNRHIGSELPRIMSHQRFIDVKTQIIPLTTPQIGIKPFLGLAVSFRLDPMQRFQRMRMLPYLRKIKQAAADPHAWGAVGIFVTSGKTPTV